MVQKSDSFDIEKSLRNLNINSFKINIDNRELFLFRRYNIFWKDDGFTIKKISQREFFHYLKKRISTITKGKYIDNSVIEAEINDKQLSNLTKSEFRIYCFIRKFQGRDSVNVFEILGKMNSQDVIYISNDRNCCLVFYKNIIEMIQTGIKINLPRVKKSIIEIWTPKESEARKILDVYNKNGYNYLTMKKAHEIFNFVAQGYISQSTHLILRKLDLAILISARNSD